MGGSTGGGERGDRDGQQPSVLLGVRPAVRRPRRGSRGAPEWPSGGVQPPRHRRGDPGGQPRPRPQQAMQLAGRGPPDPDRLARVGAEAGRHLLPHPHLDVARPEEEQRRQEEEACREHTHDRDPRGEEAAEPSSP